MAKVPRFVVPCVMFVLCCGCSSPDERAHKLYVDAVELAKEAQEVERASYSDAWGLYLEALAKIDKVMTKHSTSTVAAQLARDEVEIGSYTYSHFRDCVIPRAREKAEAEKSPVVCALLVAKKIDTAVMMRDRRDLQPMTDGSADDRAEGEIVEADGMAEVAEIAQQILLDARQVFDQAKGAEFDTWLMMRVMHAYAEFVCRGDEEALRFLHELLKGVE